MSDPAPGVYGGGTPTGLVAFHDAFVAVGGVWASCCDDGDPSLNRGVVWTSGDGHSWTLHPDTIAYDALPIAVTSDTGGFLAVVRQASLLPSGSIGSVSQIWRLASGSGPQVAAIQLGDEEGLGSVYVVGDTLVATGYTDRG